jgi:hypothetical protein
LRPKTLARAVLDRIALGWLAAPARALIRFVLASNTRLAEGCGMTKTSRRVLALGATVAAILATSLIAAAQAQKTWVAVATDDGPNFGYAVGMATREAAEMTSLGECVGSCRIRLTAPARCVAFVRSDPGNASGFGAGPTRETAQQTAWNDCNRRVPSNSCTVRVAQCFE